MQRKNNILRVSYKLKRNSRKGMAMIMAIAVIVIISTIMALSMSMTAQTTKKTADLYIYEQAILLSKSAAEYALLRIATDNNLTHPCNTNTSANKLKLNFSPDLDGDGVDDYYDINISLQYIYTSIPANCNSDDIFATVNTPEQNGSVLMDITVSVTDKNVVSEPIRYFRRSIQKL